jgi:WhiB family redox-sensing transcriptional regulator
VSNPLGELAASLDLPAMRWQADALCAEPRHAGVEFFPERGQSIEPARAVCHRCAVSEECLGYALDRKIKHGVWGGLSERERRRIRVPTGEFAVPEAA